MFEDAKKTISQQNRPLVLNYRFIGEVVVTIQGFSVRRGSANGGGEVFEQSSVVRLFSHGDKVSYTSSVSKLPPSPRGEGLPDKS